MELTDYGTVLVHRGALQLGPEVRALGIGRQEALDGHVAVRELTDRIADILIAMYDERTDDVTDGDNYERFVDLARRTVEFAFLRSLAERRAQSREKP